MEKETPIRRKLVSSIRAGVIIASIVLTLMISWLVGGRYSDERTALYKDTAFAYANFAAKYIDGDSIAKYVETRETDEYYDDVMKALSVLQEQSNLEYCYVYVPLENEILYIWDTDEPGKIGGTDPYPAGLREHVGKMSSGVSPDDVIISLDEYGFLATASVPVMDSSGELAAVVGVDVSMMDILMSLILFILAIMLCVMLVVLVAMLVLFAFMRKRIIGPITRLSKSAREMVHNLESGSTPELDIHTGDEIEELANSFVQMDIEVREYIRRLSQMTAEKERIGAELSVAAQIQADMLPRVFPAFPARSEFDIYATMKPAKEVGGDFYDFFMVDDDHLVIVIADVSGKGVPAALFMMIAKTLIKNSAEKGHSLKQVFEEVNDQLCENNEEGMFVTAWMGMLTISTGRLVSVNAGHEDPVVIRAGGAGTVKLKHGMIMAYLPGAVYHEEEIQLEPGDAVFIYTDGVSEATTAERRMYGRERLLRALESRADGTPEELLAAVREDMDRFVGDAPQFDDITMLALRLAGKQQSGLTELRMRPAADKIYEATSFVEETLTGLGVPHRQLMNINVAVDEIFSNIARCSGADELSIYAGVEGGQAVIRFRDNGAEFDPTQQKEPDIRLPADERGIGGLGVHIIKKTMDAMEYERSGGHNILTIRKNI